VPGGSGGARVGIGEAGDSVAGTLFSLVDKGVSMGRPGWGRVAGSRLGEAVEGRIARGRANGLDRGWRPTLAKGAGRWWGPAVEEVGPAAVMALPGV